MSAGNPPPNPTVAAVTAANAVRFVMNQRRLGYEEVQIRRQLQDHYPGLPAASAQAVLDRATSAAQSAEAYNFGGGAHRLQARDVRRPDPGCSQWRYTTLVGYQSASGAVDYVPVTRQWATSQERAVVETDAGAWVTSWAAQMAGSQNPNYPVTGQVSVIYTRVISVERACP